MRLSDSAGDSFQDLLIGTSVENEKTHTIVGGGVWSGGSCAWALYIFEKGWSICCFTPHTVGCRLTGQCMSYVTTIHCGCPSSFFNHVRVFSTSSVSVRWGASRASRSAEIKPRTADTVYSQLWKQKPVYTKEIVFCWIHLKTFQALLTV